MRNRPPQQPSSLDPSSPSSPSPFLHVPSFPSLQVLFFPSRGAVFPLSPRVLSFPSPHAGRSKLVRPCVNNHTSTTDLFLLLFHFLPHLAFFDDPVGAGGILDDRRPLLGGVSSIFHHSATSSTASFGRLLFLRRYPWMAAT